MDGEDDDDDPSTNYDNTIWNYTTSLYSSFRLTSTKLRTSNSYCLHRWATHVQKNFALCSTAVRIGSSVLVASLSPGQRVMTKAIKTARLSDEKKFRRTWNK